MGGRERDSGAVCPQYGRGQDMGPGDSGSFYPHNSDTFMNLDCKVVLSELVQKGDARAYICGEPGKVGAERLSQEFQGSM